MLISYFPWGTIPLRLRSLIITIAANVILLLKKTYPLRWMVIGLVLMALFTIYPIIFTIWVAFTNYGEGHLVSEKQAINQILKTKYLPVTGKSYGWTAYKSPQGDYVLWLQDSSREWHTWQNPGGASQPTQAG